MGTVAHHRAVSVGRECERGCGARKHCGREDIGWTGTSVGVPAGERARRGCERGCGSAGGWVCGCVCACGYKVVRAIKI